MKKTSDVKNYRELIATAQANRPAEVPANFVRVDLWCAEFGDKSEFTDYRRQAETKRYWNQLSERERRKMPELVFAPGRGSKAGVWVHPLIASHYASWLSADFAILVNETFLRVLEGDSDLAASMMLRDHNKERVDRAKKRVLVSGTNKETMELAKLDGANYAEVHNDRYRGLYQKTAKQLREEAGLAKDQTPLDKLSAYDLNLNSLANQMAILVGKSSAVGGVASGLRQLHKDNVGKDLEPTWESQLLRPAQAQRIAYAPEYQIELPI